MKTTIFFPILLCFTTLLSAQLSLDFSRLGLQGWKGDTSKFVVTNGVLQLMDNNPATNNQAYLSYLAPTGPGAETTWEFLVNLAFSPSTSNFPRIYLSASQHNLLQPLTGYFIQVGGVNGDSDALQLYRQDADRTTLLLSARSGGVGSPTVDVRVRVRRAEDGRWTLEADYEGGKAYVNEGSVKDNTYQQGLYLGWVCRYTSSRAKAFSLDDIEVNPLYNDQLGPVLQQVEVVDAQTLVLQFNENIDPASALDPSQYQLIPRSGVIQTIVADPQDARRVVLELSEKLQNLQEYTCTVANVKDVLGNRTPQQSLKFTYIEISTPAVGDVVINEVLFDPKSGGSDFVELYNKSAKVINLKGLQLSNRKKTTGKISTLIEGDFLLRPNGYVALTESIVDLTRRYTIKDPAALFQSDLPTLEEKEGNVTLSYQKTTLDSFDYSIALHSPLLDDEKGVSLERLNVNFPTNASGNWHSAAVAAGSATPGYLNSQVVRIQQGNTQTVFQLEEATFSPDGDGFQDVLLLNYRTNANGYLANIRVFDAQGRLIKRLVRNESLGAEGLLKWDGTTDELQKARIGVYVLWIELFEPNGRKSLQKLNCVLAGKL